MASRVARVFQLSRSRTSLPVSACERSRNVSICDSTVSTAIASILLSSSEMPKTIPLTLLSPQRGEGFGSLALGEGGVRLVLARHVAIRAVGVDHGVASPAGLAVAAAARRFDDEHLASLHLRHRLALQVAPDPAGGRQDLHVSNSPGLPT